MAAVTTEPEKRLERALAAFVRQEFGAPIATIIGLTEILLEDARRGEDPLASDLDRIHSAGLLLQDQLDRLVGLALPASFGNEADLTEFKAKLRHDLRTPLNAVKGYSELIMDEVRDTDRTQLIADVGKLLAAAQQLLGQVDKLVSLTDAAAPRSPDMFPLAGTPSRDLVGQIMQSIQPIAPTHRRDQGISSRILVVDDMAANRELLSRRLTRNGHFVEVADSGRSALEFLATGAFDMVLLDLMMPDMNGFEVLLRLKADPVVRHIPVIMISALDEIDSIVRCIEAGAEDYLPKPFDPVLLGARIDAALERKRLRDREQAFLDQLQVEKSKSDALLLNILPATIVERIRQGEVVIADRFPEATILFSDLVGFTGLAARSSPGRIIEILNHLFSAFDALAKELGLEKIKTIGDSYMVAGGLPEEQPDHALAVSDMALGMIQAVSKIGAGFGETLKVRIGIHSGDVIAGIIGQHRFIYDVWGDTVNTASRLESSGLPDRIQISEATYQRVKSTFRCELRGPVELKGKGTMVTYFLGARYD
ncbi:MAG: adenylate/guanylate cyclase domain-containing protein [Hyphomicrobiales bacterium]